MAKRMHAGALTDFEVHLVPASWRNSGLCLLGVRGLTRGLGFQSPAGQWGTQPSCWTVASWASVFSSIEWEHRYKLSCMPTALAEFDTASEMLARGQTCNMESIAQCYHYCYYNCYHPYGGNLQRFNYMQQRGLEPLGSASKSLFPPSYRNSPLLHPLLPLNLLVHLPRASLEKSVQLTPWPASVIRGLEFGASLSGGKKKRGPQSWSQMYRGIQRSSSLGSLWDRK